MSIQICMDFLFYLFFFVQNMKKYVIYLLFMSIFWMSMEPKLLSSKKGHTLFISFLNKFLMLTKATIAWSKIQ